MSKSQENVPVLTEIALPAVPLDLKDLYNHVDVLLNQSVLLVWLLRQWNKCTKWHPLTLLKMQSLKKNFSKSLNWKKNYLSKLLSTLVKPWKKKNSPNNLPLSYKNMLAKLRYSGINYKEPKDKLNKSPLMQSKLSPFILLMKWLEYQEFILKPLDTKLLNYIKLPQFIIYKLVLLIAPDSKIWSIKKSMMPLVMLPLKKIKLQKLLKKQSFNKMKTLPKWKQFNNNENST